ncbi:DUF3046 domain-containing protein [Brevibacterium sp. 5221]|uniref:DUF3046 domain-containing protein n=1 Tax=Brevibacterium rongguiense TaxID=2695267 RepID=A0A6N9H6J1_9MICO|nr:DUF3046 domain-containing protein [Brevibacterium rongguiense]MYM19491.1 DUF3046 domain-containing protein [Brevibacterium rongguiense]
MRHTLYARLMDDEFGRVRAASLHTDLALSALGSLTPAQALAAGHDPREVWTAVCDATGVPDERRLGRDPKPRSAPF